MKLTTFFQRLGNDTDGATAVEYGLIVSLIVIGMIGALQGVAGDIISMWEDVSVKATGVMGN